MFLVRFEILRSISTASREKFAEDFLGTNKFCILYALKGKMRGFS